MIVSIEVSYSARSTIDKLSREQYAKLREELDTLGLPEWPESAEKIPYWVSYGDRVLIELPRDALLLEKWGIPYTIVKFRNTYRVHDPDTNQHVHVHIPNIGLLSIRVVEVLEDACTDELQRRLDSGWSILAICPPNAARRPDYILGRAERESQ